MVMVMVVVVGAFNQTPQAPRHDVNGSIAGDFHPIQ